LFNGKATLHFMNGGLLPVPDDIKDLSGVPLIKDIDSLITDNQLEYKINTSRFTLPALSVLSAEWGDAQMPAPVHAAGKDHVVISINLHGVKIYAVAQ
jgi:hypothetical protein